MSLGIIVEVTVAAENCFERVTSGPSFDHMDRLVARRATKETNIEVQEGVLYVHTNDVMLYTHQRSCHISGRTRLHHTCSGLSSHFHFCHASHC